MRHARDTERSHQTKRQQSEQERNHGLPPFFGFCLPADSAFAAGADADLAGDADAVSLSDGLSALPLADDCLESAVPAGEAASAPFADPPFAVLASELFALPFAALSDAPFLAPPDVVRFLTG